MAIAVQCVCGKAYQVRPEYAGRTVACPACGEAIEIGAAGGDADSGGIDPAFNRDKFLLRQKALAISEKYFVWDEAGREILFIERPAHLLRNLAAVLGGIVVAGLVAGILITLAVGIDSEPLSPLLTMVGIAGGAVAFFFTLILLYKKRHITFYRDSGKQETMLKIFQDKKVEFITATYTIADAQDQVIGRLRKNHLYNIIRRRWQCFAPDGSLTCLALEDSLILSMLRRLLGTFFGLLRVNFIFMNPETKEVIGEFNRKFTLLDRYALDMSADTERRLDRRVALALGLMLDTGERR
jgi:uncharacterized protein YxjI